MSLAVNELNNRTDFGVFIPGFFDDYPLESSEFRLYAHIQRRAGTSGCFESIPNMAKHCYVALKTAKNAIKLLLAAGMIEIQERLGTTNIYTLTPPSKWVSPDQVQLLRSQIKTTKQTPAKINPSQNCTGGGVKSDPSGGVNFARGVGSNLTHKGIPIKVIPSKELTLSTEPPSRNALPTHQSVCEESGQPEQQNQEKQPIPESFTSLSNQSETLHQTENPSSGPNIPAASFEKREQANKPSKQKFQSIEDLINQVLLDPAIMASDPLPAVYRSEIKLRGWRFPWRTATRDKIYQTCSRQLVELIAKERAKWSKCEWTEKIPTVIKSIGNLEATKGGLEELLGYWSKVVESAAPQTEESGQTDQPIGYYSNRSLEWHKATFCELLDLGDKVGHELAIAQFSTRYDQQHTGATDGWLNWLSIHYPQMYAHLHQAAA
ncbi:helix-turn-helix domain-containing protein [Nostoc sp. ChiQUE01b]|uniref:helix-turn-helix domain-containing protein n=1 Tax=Nostoc sp. ChiQUE01b TaxID=3075376 RepID=UPI002AD478AB|nr:helix-turn-helix domain-containing protein [Nostoc sp. ChiQUE01b]MDZ8261952.1 helix-turn-helix domain-containing protein [Nostoc sp. ChiQUE01b]